MNSNCRPQVHFSLGVVRLVQILAVIILLYSGTAAQTNDITYIYDELGRLVAVVDPAGDTAVYSYDSVGNLLSIARHSSSVASIVQFTPKHGSIGTTVTIYGTGFSGNASEDAISFNGVAATTISATSTKLVTTVPASATTGLITVTTPAGAAVSSAAFTVTNSNAPTIIGFSPLLGDPGTAVAITGTNFETIATNNRVTFNGTLAPATNSSVTSISANVPNQPGMGRIAVTTPFGTAVSAEDFFIPPPPYTTADIQSTAWIAVDETKTATVTVAGKVAVLFFHGVAAQRMSAKLANVTNQGFATVINPDGTQLTIAYADTNGGLVEMPSLPLTGSYAIIVSPRDANNARTTGSMTLTLYNVPADITGNITAGGSSVTVTTTVPGQNGVLTFSASADERINLIMSSVTFPLSDVSIIAPDESVLAGSYSVTTDGGSIGSVTLPVAGEYRIFINPQIFYIGSMALSLTDVSSSPPTITAIAPLIGAVGTSVNLTGTNFDPVTTNNTLSFNGVSAVVGTATATVIGANVPIGATSGHIRVSTAAGSAVSSDDFFVPPSPYVATDVAFTDRTSLGQSKTATISAAGKIAMLLFDGTAGHRLSLNVSNGTMSWALVSVISPTGTTVLGPTWTNGTQFFEPTVLSATGTYTIIIDPENANTGSLTVTPWDVPADPAGTITPGGSATTLTSTAAGQNLSLTFSGTSTQRISLQLSSTTTWSQVSIMNPNGTTLMAPTWVNGSGFFDTMALGATGTYTIVIDPELANFGNFTFTLYDVPPDITGTISSGGAPLTATTTTPGQNIVVTFSGTAGDKAMLVISNVSISGTGWSQVSVLKPDSTVLIGPTWVNNSGKTFDTVTLPATGTYTIKIDPELANTGNVTLTLTNPSIANDDFANAQVISGSSNSVAGTSVGATKETGEPNHAGNSGGKSVWYRWQAPQNGQVTINTISSSFDTELAVYTGTAVASLTEIASNDDGNSDHTSRLTFTAVADTVYYIAVDGFQGATGNLVLSWNLASGTPTVQADYRFQNTHASSTGSPPALVDLGSNSFTSATVDGTATTVLSFAQNNGVSFSPTTGVVANDAYTLVLLFSFSDVNAYRRVFDFKHGTSDYGLYVQNGHLYFYPAASGSASISASAYVQVVLTRDAAGTVTGYLGGVQQFQFSDTSGVAIIDGQNTLRLFRDDGTEASSGAVARFRLYNGPLTAEQVGALDRLPAGP